MMHAQLAKNSEKVQQYKNELADLQKKATSLLSSDASKLKKLT
jgi:hypothetical protein